MEVELTSSDVECPYTNDSTMGQVLYDFNFWCEGVVGCMIYIPGQLIIFSVVQFQVFSSKYQPNQEYFSPPSVKTQKSKNGFISDTQYIIHTVKSRVVGRLGQQDVSISRTPKKGNGLNSSTSRLVGHLLFFLKYISDQLFVL